MSINKSCRHPSLLGKADLKQVQRSIIGASLFFLWTDLPKSPHFCWQSQMSAAGLVRFSCDEAALHLCCAFGFLSQASSPHSQAPTVDVSQLHDPHGYSQQPIQLQHVQVSEASGTSQATAQVKHLRRSEYTSPFNPRVNLWKVFTLSGYSCSSEGYQPAAQPHHPAGEPGADPRHLSPESEQQPAAGDRAAHLHTWKLELPRLQWVPASCLFVCLLMHMRVILTVCSSSVRDPDDDSTSYTVRHSWSQHPGVWSR